MTCRLFGPRDDRCMFERQQEPRDRVPDQPPHGAAKAAEATEAPV